MRMISWNVNGLRACLGKGFLDFFKTIDADIFCLQETKMQQGQAQVDTPGYFQYWNSAEKKGYSGTAVFTKERPVSVYYGMGIAEHDKEGRVITCEYPGFYLVNVYTPNAQQGLTRLDYRVKWEEDFRAYLAGLAARKPVAVCGDMNVAHQEIDLKNPKSNRGNAGFTDQERRQMTLLLLPLQRPEEQRRMAHRLFFGFRQPKGPGVGGRHLSRNHGQRPLPCVAGAGGSRPSGKGVNGF